MSAHPRMSARIHECIMNAKTALRPRHCKTSRSNGAPQNTEPKHLARQLIFIYTSKCRKTFKHVAFFTKSFKSQGDMSTKPGFGHEMTLSSASPPILHHKDHPYETHVWVFAVRIERVVRVRAHEDHGHSCRRLGIMFPREVGVCE